MMILMEYNGVVFEGSTINGELDKDGHIWANANGISMPLTMHYDEDVGLKYAYFHTSTNDVEAEQIRVYLFKKKDDSI